MIIDLLDQIIGTLPIYGSQSYNQYEIVRYVIAGVVLIFMLTLVYRVFIAIFGRWLRS